MCAVGFVCAIVAELAATAGMSLIDWEAEWAESGTAHGCGHGSRRRSGHHRPAGHQEERREKVRGELR